MEREQEKGKTIFMGYHPRTHDGSSPRFHTLSDATAVMEAFNASQADGTLRAEVVEIACRDQWAVAVMETTIGKVWQYL